MSDMTRRDLIMGAGVAAAVTVGTGAAVANAEEASWMPGSWADEADLIVVGYGGAGCLATIAGLYEGASVITLEKSSERDGGSTAASGGHIHTCVYADPDEYWYTYNHGCFGAGAPEDVFRAYAAHIDETPEWCEKYGIDINWLDEGNDGHKRPEEYQGGYIMGKDGVTGMYLFEAIDEVAMGMGADVRLNNRAQRLIQNPITKEIIGVTAIDADGNELNYKAKKGVILACGGYENNPKIQYNYNNPGIRVFPWGSPNNTGDGFPMVQAVGADLWHMHALEWSSLCYMKPSIEANCSISTDATDGITPYNYVIINQNGKRFFKEDKTGAHDMDHQNALDFSSKKCDYINLPMFLVFDQTMFEAQNPMWHGTGRAGIINTYAGVWNFHHPDNKILTWDSNDEAIERGWIFKGDTIEELAAAIKGDRPCGDPDEAIDGIDAETLAETIARWNELCANGEDTDFSRDPSHMLPLDNPPYYAIELGFSSINTQGGPVRNGECQTIDAFGNVIPRLYNVGEFGSYNAFVYGVGNILESLTTGRVAAQHAVTLEPWA